ncbi:MAG: hypothetical protein ABSD98_02070 [Candidatus Korobacteraceae bacterium]|jgi:hypothetical protein
MDRGSDSDETFTQAVVRLSVANPAPWKELPDPFAGLWFAIVQAIDGRDLDAHIAMLILRRSGSCVDPTLELLSRKLAAGAALDSGLSRSKDVAIIGARLALNIHVSNLDHFDRAVRRELARQPLPPLACIHDDERLLIGVAAGIGKACPVLSSELVRVLQSRPHANSIRQQCVDLWAESLSCGEERFSTKLAERGIALLRASMSQGSSITPEDCVLLCWLANKLLESEWLPRREEPEAVLEFVNGQAYSLRGLIALLGTITPVDAAFLLSFHSLPSLRTTKKGLPPGSEREADRSIHSIGSVPPRLNYRSSIKRAILAQLIRDPDATDAQVCRALDADGAVDLPKSWQSNPRERLFFGAYSDSLTRHKVETTISRVRQDWRKQGLPPRW